MAKRSGWTDEQRSSFSENIKSVREHMQLTQEQMAKLLDVTSISVSRYERGAMPSGQLLVSMARRLGTTMDILLKPNMPLPKREPWRFEYSIIGQSPDGFRVELAKLYEKFRKMTPK